MLCGIILIVLVSSASCSGNENGTATDEEDTMTTIALTSSAFSDGTPIPTKYTGDGEDVSPPLKWGDVPDGTKSIALICDDPDAPVDTWVHWVVFNIPPTATELPEGVPTTETVLDGAKQGRNDFRRLGYGGPAPPPGKSHRYFFKLYVLDTELDLNAGATKKELLRAMKGHILCEGQLIGTYRR